MAWDEANSDVHYHWRTTRFLILAKCASRVASGRPCSSADAAIQMPFCGRALARESGFDLSRMLARIRVRTHCPESASCVLNDGLRIGVRLVRRAGSKPQRLGPFFGSRLDRVPAGNRRRRTYREERYQSRSSTCPQPASIVAGELFTDFTSENTSGTPQNCFAFRTIDLLQTMDEIRRLFKVLRRERFELFDDFFQSAHITKISFIGCVRADSHFGSDALPPEVAGIID
jgi:hypothetical protein